MIYYQYIITGLIALILINFIINLIFFKNIKNFELPARFKDSPSLISILIPARNEESNINKLLVSLIRQDYKNLEILVLDDNSIDSTSSIVKQMILRDPRIRLITGKKLEEGWLGKSWACHQLAIHSNGQYFIFTDADTFHHHDAVSKALAALEQNNLDGLSVYPRQIMVTFAERMLVPFIGMGIFTLFPILLIKKTKSKFFCTGIGQFFMFKKEAYFKSGGHESVKAEILEDIHLSKRLKAAGFSYMIFDGSSNIFCRMYKNFREAISGFSKFIFAAFNYNGLSEMFAISSFSLIFLVPFILLPISFIFEWPKILVTLNITQILLIFTIKTIISFKFKERILDTLLTPLSICYIIAAAINSFIQARFRNGIYWKGRTYDVKTPENISIASDDYCEQESFEELNDTNGTKFKI